MDANQIDPLYQPPQDFKPAAYERFFAATRAAGCPKDQVENFLKAGVILQDRQLAFAAAARSCDNPDGPTAILTGGARGGGKSTCVLAQLAVDDCQRYKNLKWLWLRKVGKANLEHLDDMRRTLLRGLPHSFRRNDGTITLPNGSRIICGHFQNENDVDSYLGIEYDGIAVEEATTLQESKHKMIRTCLRSSKPGWRPREYLTANPGGISHGHIKKRFIVPYRAGREMDTRFIPSRCVDNHFNNPEYIKVLQSLVGWQRRAWLDGDWDITAGQFFTNFREDKHVIDHFDDKKALSWFGAFDFGYSHFSVFLLFAVTGDGTIVVVDEHAVRRAVPAYHVEKIKRMMATHGLLDFNRLDYLVAGSDIFATESDGASVASEYAGLGMHMTCAEMDRVNGWSRIIHLFGDPDEDRAAPKLLIHRRCAGLIERIPLLQHNPNRPEDVEKVDCDDDTGDGGDDHPDCLRYGIASYRASQIITNAMPLAKLDAFGATA